MTTTGIFLKQEKKLEGLARKWARRERGYPSERSETFHRFSLFMWDWPRPRQGRWRKSDWLLSKFPFPWPPLRLQFLVIFLSSSFLKCVFSQTLLCLLLAPSSHTPKVLMRTQGKKALSDLEDKPGNQKGFPLCYQPDLSLWGDGHASVYDNLCERWPLLTPLVWLFLCFYLPNINPFFLSFSDFCLGM